jgi:heme iron utilization protein
LRARYRERVPNSDGYLKTHDFDFWRMRTIHQVRYIAGFGRICWFDGDELITAPQDAPLKEIMAGAIEHMNDDHRDALESICDSLHGYESTDVRMTDLDRRGFFMTRAGEPSLLYTSFGYEVSAKELRRAMVDVTRRARALGD